MTRFASDDIYELVRKGVDEDGLVPFARNKKLPLGVVRSVLDRRNLSASSLEQLSDALNVHIAFGKPPAPDTFARWLQEAYGDMFEVANYVQNLSRLLGTSATETEIDGHRFATVARHDAQAAAGGGRINFDGPPIDHLAFSKTWLLQNGIQAGSCSLINAIGKSMEPSIYDGDLIMIDHRKTQIRNRKVYVYNDPQHGTRVKRLELVPDHAIIARSDNPDQNQYQPEYYMGEAMNVISLNVIGEVVWSGHKWA